MKFVKSPPYIINFGIILWKIDPVNDSGLPLIPFPFSPVHRALKFSAVFGVTSPNNPISTLPIATLSADRSNFTVCVTFSDSRPQKIDYRLIIMNNYLKQ